jgi:hypothetical protein
MNGHTPQLGDDMSNADETSAGDGFWASARATYEDPMQNIDALAETLGLTRHRLVLEAKARGWMLRGAGRTATTRATIARFRELLQKRLTALEAEVHALGNGAKDKRDISDINLLVRTLEKVLQLERRERETRIKRRKLRLRFTDAERSELARRIASLRRQPPGNGGGGVDFGGAGEARQPGLGALVEAEPASAGEP